MVKLFHYLKFLVRKVGVTLLVLVPVFMIASSTAYLNQANGVVSSGQNNLIYGCVPMPTSIHCDPVQNKFSSVLVTGEAKKVYTVTKDSVELVPGKFGNALPLKGYIGEYLTIPNNPSINPNTFTISLWAKHDAFFALDSSIISHTNLVNPAGWSIGVKISPKLQIQFAVVNTQGKSFITSTPITKGKFEHVVGTFDGMTVKLFLNGVLVNSSNFFGKYQPDPGVPLNVGIDSFDLANAWKGSVDDIRLFNRDISDSEIKNIFTGGFQSLPGLVGYWPFDNNTKDGSGNRNDGIITIQAVSMAFAPGNRLYFTEKNAGEVKIMQDDIVLPQPFVKLRNVYVAQHQGLLGITLDPMFDTNHYAYVYYTYKENQTASVFNKVVRFTELNNKATEEKVLLDKIPASPDGEFAGGALAFGPDDKLYISVGHANSPDLPQNKSSLLGKILRIDRDGTIPPDNPFPGSPVYTLGHRNIFGIAFDKKSGIGVVTENGDAHFDEINILKKGGNYGFPTLQPADISPQLGNNSSIKPIRAYWETIAPTQAIFYDGEKFPVFKDKLLFGSYNKGFIYALGLNNNNSITDEMAIEFNGIEDNAIALAQSSSGDVYFGAYNIYKLTSINILQSRQMIYFIEFTLNGAEVENPSFDINKATLSFLLRTNTEQDTLPPFIQVKVPKVLLDGIFEVSSVDHPSNQTKYENPIVSSEIKEQYKTSNIGDTIINIKLNKGANDLISIKGLKSNPQH